MDEETREHTTREIEPTPPMPNAGLPPSVMLEHLRYYGENESLRQYGHKIMGDIPGEEKVKSFALTNKNVVNANLTEKEVKQSRLKAQRIKMFRRAFTEDSKLTADEIMIQEQIELDYYHRLSQGRDGFGTKQRTTMTSIHLQGQADSDKKDNQPTPRFM